jgi:hypothetical protein
VAACLGVDEGTIRQLQVRGLQVARSTPEMDATPRNSA